MQTTGRLTFTTNGPEETRALGSRLGRELCPGDVVALVGDLGAGKTCLVQGIAQGLGVPESSYVRSPSFVLLNIYPGRCVLHHLDLYRMRSPGELEDLGYREILYGQGVTVIEWADKIETFLPGEHLRISMAFLGETERRLVLEGIGPRPCGQWERLRDALQSRGAGG